MQIIYTKRERYPIQNGKENCKYQGVLFMDKCRTRWEVMERNKWQRMASSNARKKRRKMLISCKIQWIKFTTLAETERESRRFKKD